MRCISNKTLLHKTNLAAKMKAAPEADWSYKKIYSTVSVTSTELIVTKLLSNTSSSETKLGQQQMTATKSHAQACISTKL